jgi:15-cis-phytoene synthase
MSIQACAELVHRGDPDRFLATMTAPLAAREILLPIYAFNLEVARAPWVTKEAMIAEMRLQWWRDALEEIAAGGTVRRHEVVTPLADVLDGEAVRLLDGVVTARSWDIYSDAFEDQAAFEAHIEATSAALMWVAARALGAKQEPVFRAIGYASGIASWFRAIPELENQGRKPLVDGRASAVASLAEGALARLATVTSEERAGRPAALAAWQARALLKQAAREPARVAEGSLGTSGFARHSSLMLARLRGRV